MGIPIGIVVIFILMMILGVPNEIIVFIALGILLLFSLFCNIFFLVSLINLFRSKKVEGVFTGLVYSDCEEITDVKSKNRIAFAGYKIGKKDIIRNLFPTDDFMSKLYKENGSVSLNICRIGKNTYVIDGVTKVIIFIGLPVFAIMTAILTPLIMQYMYIFNM